MEGDPFVLIEGMTIAGLAVGATEGYIYLRVEYPHAQRALQQAIAAAYERGYLGANVLGSGKGFDLDICASAPARTSAAKRPRCSKASKASAARSGPAATPRRRRAVRQADDRQQRHFAGERADHPRPGRRVLSRLRHGPVARDAADSARRKHQARRPGREGVRRSRCASCSTTTAAARASGRPIRAVQAGGPLGAYMPASQFDTPLDYEAFVAGRRDARPRRLRRLRRHRRHGPDGALCHGVLRHRILRQVHALPDRIDPRRRGASIGLFRQSTGRRTWRCSTSCATR